MMMLLALTNQPPGELKQEPAERAPSGRKWATGSAPYKIT